MVMGWVDQSIPLNRVMQRIGQSIEQEVDAEEARRLLRDILSVDDGSRDVIVFAKLIG